MARGEIDPVDRHVGEQLRLQRMEHRISQEELGGKVGVSFQQLQKYEKGLNRVSASMLWRLSVALGVPVSYFYEGLTTNGTGKAALVAQGATKADIELMGVYLALPAELKKSAAALIKAMYGAHGV